MATDEHKQLAKFIKNVHSGLRKAAAKGDAVSVWREHCNNTSVLNQYAECMQKLAITYWEENSTDSTKMANSRIDWAAHFCCDYFLTDLHLNYRTKELEIALKIGLQMEEQNIPTYDKIKLLDVGSCYNPFKNYDYFDVLALDLCPANENVAKCDFLNVTIGQQTNSVNNEIIELKKGSFDAVTFCFVLEYLPTSTQRKEACRRACILLKPEGLLVIATPDSKHVGANSRIMKCWRYTLARLGFSRIKYNKFPHMHCMAFRKSLHMDIAKRWATLHQDSSMTFELNIPQDFQEEKEESDISQKLQCNEDSVAEDFKELPEIELE